jgi:hypothetical protein
MRRGQKAATWGWFTVQFHTGSSAPAARSVSTSRAAPASNTATGPSPAGGSTVLNATRSAARVRTVSFTHPCTPVMWASKSATVHPGHDGTGADRASAPTTAAASAADSASTAAT